MTVVFTYYQDTMTIEFIKMVKIKFRDIINELFTKIRTKITQKMREFEEATEILSYDQEVMSSLNIWPIDQVRIRFLLLAILTTTVPSVCINL